MKKSENQRDLPLISVGIPTYNRPEYLRRTLVDIRKQTYQNLEIIVSDNASTGDETRMVVEEFMRDDTRIRYFRQSENRGANFNFQFVLDQARGEYFMWAADDDRRSGDFIYSLWSELDSDTSAIAAFSDFDVIDRHGDKALGYSDPIETLRLMKDARAVQRQLRFFLLKEGRAVPHIIYGLIPMRIIRGFSWKDFFDRYGIYGADVLFIFWMLGQGRLALVERKLFGCTVNNEKYYSLAQRRTLTDILGTFVRRVAYLSGFIRIAKGWPRLVLIAVFPLKLSEMLFSMVVREPLRKLRRILGRQG